MSALRELYQDVILDHYRSPRNSGALAGANRTAEGDNPVCGDKTAVSLRLSGDIVEDIRQVSVGCAISTASASIMSEAVKGMRVEEIHRLFRKFHGLVTLPAGEQDGGELGKLGVFAGVREFPVRIKCATLAWHTLLAAIENKRSPVTTEE